MFMVSIKNGLNIPTIQIREKIKIEILINKTEEIGFINLMFNSEDLNFIK
jgi:hypothetical protein